MNPPEKIPLNERHAKALLDEIKGRLAELAGLLTNLRSANPYNNVRLLLVRDALEGIQELLKSLKPPVLNSYNLEFPPAGEEVKSDAL